MESYADTDSANSSASNSSDSYLPGSRKVKKCSKDDYAKKYKNYERSYYKEKDVKNRSQQRSSSHSPVYDKTDMTALAKLHGAREKLRHISIKQESPETDSSGGSRNKHRRHQTPNDYDSNRKIKQEPIDDYDYSSHTSSLNAVGGHESSQMKHRVSRWEQEDASISVKQEFRSPSHSRSRSPVHRHRHYKSYHRSSHREQHRDHHDSNRHRQRDERQREDRKREAAHKRRGGENPFVTSTSDFAGRGHNSNAANEALVKEKPNMELSGKLTEHSNTYNGIVVKYNEPAEARKPKRRWRLYPFKGVDELPVLPIHRQSAYLIGRERLVADIPVGHPSISKQHAVLQFRKVPFNRADGTTGFKVRPYIIDLNSSNGTYINCKRIQSQCYVELFEKDLIKFGFSTREYVILHEESNTREVQADDEVSE